MFESSEAVRVFHRTTAAAVRYHQEGRLLEQHDLLGLADAAELVQSFLYQLDVRDQTVHDRAPRAVECLVPDRGPETTRFLRQGEFAHLVLFGLEHCVALLFGHEIHLVNETEDLGVLGVLTNGLYALLVVLDVLVDLFAVHIEHVHEHFYVAEDVIALRGEVVLHERVLTVVATVSQCCERCVCVCVVRVESSRCTNTGASAALTRHSPTSSTRDCRGSARASAPHPLSVR